jgi:hypothetical protein
MWISGFAPGFFQDKLWITSSNLWINPLHGWITLADSVDNLSAYGG